ncbi:MAG TPA: prepilin-type N-terminal cleavage/methylation domain-containing protein [Anaeromyxobacter sp.]|nr:prepilin-type N-terminal cleavage/methylation domain-containing protein [Anaeromyxobacter sp.]
MANPTRTAGFTVLEAMVAMAITLIGTMGLISLHYTGTRMNADARIMTRATAIAQDLIDQMQGWNYALESQNGGRLFNTNTANDGDFADADANFQTKEVLDGTDYDHAEDELEASPNGWFGTSTAEVQGLGFTRYWNVVDADYDTNNVLLGKRVAAIVRWGEPGRWRRIVLITYIQDPQIAF